MAFVQTFRDLLSQQEIDEFNQIDDICLNLQNDSGKNDISLIKLLQRQIQLILKAIDVHKQRYNVDSQPLLYFLHSLHLIVLEMERELRAKC